MERKPAVAVVFHHIGPYHHARLNAAADRLSVTGIEWSAKACDAWGAADAPARYDKISLFSEATEQYPAKTELRRAFLWALEQTKPDAVAVNGWNNFGSLVTVSSCLRRGIPMVVMSESARHDEPRTWSKEMIKRRIVAFFSAALVGGQRHTDYLVELGMPRERVFTGYDVVDNAYFRQRTEEIRSQRSEVRQKYSLPENYFLASARFIEKKNLLRLIRAYAEYQQLCRASVSDAEGDSDGRVGALRRPDTAARSPCPEPAQTPRIEVSSENSPWDLVLLGDGPLRETLNTQLSTLNLRRHVHLPGFKPYHELPVYYALANAFVHASTTEQWGLVVNEAIASGLPVIVSSRCGCVPEMVNGNGFTFDPFDEQELAERLLKMASLSDDERKRFSDASYGISANFAPERFGEGLEQAARLAVNRPRKASPVGRALIIAVETFVPRRNPTGGD
jgi:glycosyltransferase involved in cell wall biosynthesis